MELDRVIGFRVRAVLSLVGVDGEVVEVVVIARLNVLPAVPPSSDDGDGITERPRGHDAALVAFEERFAEEPVRTWRVVPAPDRRGEVDKPPPLDDRPPQ
ncbi:hypothetical protein GCM10009037_01700 [Halarchaeum grantii]|uniref:Uncharacterized protein n=1 Tax=Halarchaeum grantii TaxID=1193105 RepID=A0A830EYB1_9EURY|nr:hypothetical protein [Halarchaeum grantii]GGL21987.1 hypothetical protein GCM10009037_01700 [Halarchaeum grantii]